MSSKRVTVHRRRICAMGAGVLLFLSGWLPAATASPPDPPQSTAFANGCPLQRIGTQLIRCDNLTGAGVRAPSWIPELTSRADDQRIPPGSPEPGKDRPPGPTIVQVRGRQFPVDAEQGRYSMLGDLIGRWTIRSARGLPGYFIPEAPWTMVQTGQERFVGCVDRNHSQRCDPGEPSGALGFDYVLWMQYDPDSGWLIEGKCLHPVTGGSGDFAGARGVLTMLAGPVGRGEQVNSTYKGEIVLNAIPNERAMLPNDDAPAGSAVRAAGC